MKTLVGVLAVSTIAICGCSSGNEGSPTGSATSTSTLRPADDVAAEGIAAGAVGTPYVLGGVGFTVNSLKKEVTDGGQKRVVVTARFENKANPEGTVPGMVVVCEGDVETGVEEVLTGTYWADSPVTPGDDLPAGTFKDGVLLPTLEGPGTSPASCDVAKLRVFSQPTYGGDSGMELIYEKPIDFAVPAGIYDKA